MRVSWPQKTAKRQRETTNTESGDKTDRADTHEETQGTYQQMFYWSGLLGQTQSGVEFWRQWHSGLMITKGSSGELDRDRNLIWTRRTNTCLRVSHPIRVQIVKAWPVGPSGLRSIQLPGDDVVSLCLFRYDLGCSRVKYAVLQNTVSKQ